MKIGIPKFRWVHQILLLGLESFMIQFSYKIGSRLLLLSKMYGGLAIREIVIQYQQ